ncbi:SDR family oxidoreductase [Nocardia thailandica]|uniref:SDR family oxidoreductase n=1 Tax=Nocardia thailandica TaxID=257275 RepID=A0ABW6PHZ9_9NOCA
MRIAVLGATGRIGATVSEILTGRGHDVVALTRTGGVDAYTGAGLSEALRGADAVIDAGNTGITETAACVDFFRTVARRVSAAAADAGVRRIAVISIIGIDEFTDGHYAGKLAQERQYRAGTVPVRVLRAAQFHEFTEMMLEWTTDGDTATIPAFRAQLVAAATVAEHLADLVTADDGPALLEVAGPEVWNLAEACAKVAARRGHPALVREATESGDPDAGRQAGGALLPGPTAILAGPTLDEWLATREFVA